MIKLAIMIIASPAKHCRAGSDISWLSFQATEKQLFEEILRLIAGLRPRPGPA
jgi:hypothetical protein